MNGGFCSAYTINGFREEICECRKYNGTDIFIGDNCEIPFVCRGDPCQNGGKCYLADLDDPLKASFICLKNVRFDSKYPRVK